MLYLPIALLRLDHKGQLRPARRKAMGRNMANQTCECMTPDQTGTLNGYMCDWHRTKFIKAMDESRQAGMHDGIRFAAEFAGTWDSAIDSPHKFEDIILCKFALRRGKPRKKRKRKR